MPIFFDYEKLLKHAKNNPDKIVSLLKLYYEQKTQKRYISLNLAGKGFLLNPKPFFEDSSNSVYKAQYIILASRRDYFIYKNYGIKSLQLSYFPDINLEKLKYNSLLTITKTEIKFKYEEI